MRGSVESVPALRVTGLSVRYNTRDVLVSANINLRRGELVVLLGPNGCGKSTLLKSIAGIVPSHAGQVLLAATDITNNSTHDLVARGIGLLLQGGAIFPSLTVQENLLIAVRKPKTAHGLPLLEGAWDTFPKLHPSRSKRAGLLSGGERQMLALAMLVVQGGEVWLLDEPSGGLAPEGVARIMELIRHVNELRKVSILMVEQNVRESLHVADRACYLKAGAIVDLGAPQNISASKLLADVYSKES